MKKVAPILILLTTIIIPFIAWGGTMLFDHESRISKNETLNKRIIMMETQIKEIHKAVHGY